MTWRALLLPLAAVLVASAACADGDDRLSTEQYLTSVEDADVSDEEFEAAVAGRRARDGASEFGALARRFADELQGLKPPEDLQEEHDELLAAAREVARALRVRAAGIDEGAGPELLQTILAEEPEVLAAIRRIDDALGALQARADAMGIDVALIPEGGSTRAAGSNAVDVMATEFEFIFDESDLTTETTGLTLINTGVQAHELSFARVADDFDVEAAVNSPAVEEVMELGFTLAQPGERQELGFGRPLEPGHYAIVCFVDDPKTGKTHAQLGMFADVTID